jgi:hypothetical protein
MGEPTMDTKMAVSSMISGKLMVADRTEYNVPNDEEENTRLGI